MATTGAEAPVAKIVVLGGCGGVGSIAVRALTATDDYDEIVVADQRADDAGVFAGELAGEMERPGLRGVAVDAASRESVAEVIRGADAVLNCIGPFYRFGPPLLEAAIEAGVDYVDVCDDLDATVRQLDLDAHAREAGVTALIGMGNSPGLANVFARLCADDLLDEVESVDIMHIHGGEPDEGAGVLKHRIHAMTNDVPLFVDGEMVQVRMLEESGQRFVQETEFRDVGTYPAYPYPHPETITLPRNMAGLRRATNLGAVFPLNYFSLTMDLVRAGLGADEPLVVDGQKVAPIDVAVAHLRAQRPRLLAEAGITGPAGCLRVVVGGRKGGEPHTYVCSLSSTSEGAGEGTGIPAALGAILLHRGRVAGPGVRPPEAAVVPAEMLALASVVVKEFPSLGGRMPFHLEHLGPDGAREEIPFAV